MKTTLTFLENLRRYEDEKPFRFVGFPNLPEKWQSNCEYIDQEDITITDVRGNEKSFSLAEAGFAFRQHRSACDLSLKRFDTRGKDFSNLTAYLEESIALVRAELGEQRVMCFDWRIRKNNPKAIPIPAEDAKNIRHYAISPASNVHCDFSRQGGWDRLAMHLSEEEMAEVEKGLWHVQFINVWRPLRLVENAPLVLCDRRTVKPGDLVEVDKVLPEKLEYTLYMLHQEYQKWYWLSRQTPEEVTLFVTWDSKKHELCADMPPHGAGLHLGKSDTAPRESIEVRLLVMSPL